VSFYLALTQFLGKGMQSFSTCATSAGRSKEESMKSVG